MSPYKFSKAIKATIKKYTFALYIQSKETKEEKKVAMKNSELMRSLELKLESLMQTKFEELKCALTSIKEGIDYFKAQIDTISCEIASIKNKAIEDKDESRNELSRIIANINRMFVTKIASENDIKELIEKASGVLNPEFVVVTWFDFDHNQGTHQSRNAIIKIDNMVKDKILKGKGKLKLDPKFNKSYIDNALTKLQREELKRKIWERKDKADAETNLAIKNKNDDYETDEEVEERRANNVGTKKKNGGNKITGSKRRGKHK